MDSKKVNGFQQLLLKEKDEIKSSIKSIQGMLKVSEQESTGELSQYDNHSGDSATTVFDRQKDLGLMDNERVILNQIEEALGKIEEGTYGYCSRCRQEIDLERLEALPYATMCINCQKNMEHEDDRVLRPMEEARSKNPFARTFNDCEDATGFDGEDSWQAVASYNKLAHQAEYEGSTDEDADDLGYVEPVEKISNRQYRNQLE